MPGSNPKKQRSPRHRWPISEKRRIVELSLREGVSTRVIAHEQGVNPTSLCHWKALYRAGKLDAQLPQGRRVRASSAPFLPVTIAPAVEALRSPGHWGAGDPLVVQITLSSGATLRIETGALDTGVVCALLAQLQR